MKKLALALCVVMSSMTAQAQTVYHVDRVIDTGTVRGTITVHNSAIPGQIGPEDIISWSFETNDGLSDPPPAHGPIVISSDGVGGLEGDAWAYLSATESELLFDFDGAYDDSAVFGIGFNDGGAGFSVTYGLAGFVNGKLEQLVHFFDDPVPESAHYVDAVQTGVVVIGTTDPVVPTRAELPRRYEPLDLSSIVNSDLGGTAFGSIFPPPGPTTFGGIPFTMTDGGNGNTSIVEGLQFGPNGPFNPASVFSIPGLNIEDATTMYAQINSAFGICGAAIGSIGLSGPSSGVDFDLVEGKNVRDWLEGPFCNTQTDAVFTANYDFAGGDGIPSGDARLDVYGFDLSGFSGPINEFRFENFGLDFWLGAPFLSAVTFEFKGYNYEYLDYPGTPATQVFGINEKGDVVGNGLDDFGAYPFVYSANKGVLNDVPNATGYLSTVVLGVSKTGHMVGSVTSGAGDLVPLRSGFIRDPDGSYTFFDHPGVDDGTVCQTNARSINVHGLVSGFLQFCDGSRPSGFIYDSQTQVFTDIVPSLRTFAHDINVKGDVVGDARFSEEDDPCDSPGSNRYGWLRSADGDVTYFQVNGQSTIARGVNDAGFVVGYFWHPSSGSNKGFRVKLDGASSCESVSIDDDEILDFPGAWDTLPEDISNADVVVGIVTDESGTHGFIARPK